MNHQPYIILNDGRAMPQVGLGVWQAPNDEVARVVKTAVEAGYRAVDTALIYHNEEGVGAGLRQVDAPVFVTTKLWNDDQGYDSALRAFEASLKRLGRESVDLYLIHWPAPRKNLYVDSWKALVRLHQEGRALSIGVSNFNGEQIDRIHAETGVMPAVNQVELHPRFQQSALRQDMLDRKVATQSWSPLGSGSLLNEATLGEIGAKYGKSTAQVILRWHVQNGLLVIPKSVHPDRIRANIDIFDFDLDEDDLSRIRAMDDPRGRVGADPATAAF